MKTYIYLILVIFSILNSSCKDENEGPFLPPKTTTGENTLGFLVNGEIFVAEQVYLWDPATAVDVTDTSLAINASGRLGKLNISILSNFNGIGVYNYENGFKDIYFSNHLTDIVYEDLLPEHADLRITHLDTTQSIISGAFTMQVRSETGEVAIISEGRFDLNYRKY